MLKSKNAASFNKILPNIAQITEDDNPNEMPRFGQSLVSETPLVED